MSFGTLAVIVCAGLGGPLLALGRRGLVPVVVGELAAGVAVGKTGTHWVDAGEPTTAFLSNVGFAMLMFTAGMHVPIRQPGIGRGLRRGAVAAIVTGAFSAPAGIGIAAALGGGHAAIYLVRGRELLHRIRRASKRRGWALDLRLALLALFTLGWIAIRAGTSILIAGFSVGLLVALFGGPKRLSTQVTGIAAGFFMPLFFVTLGARLDLRALFSHPSMLELTALLTVANVAVHAVGALATRQPLPAALAATAQLGLPAGVVTLGLLQHVLSASQGGAILLAALVTIALCPAGIALLVRTRATAPTAEQP